MQAFGRQRRLEGFADACGGRRGIVGRLAIAPVEDEGGGRQGRIGADGDLAGVGGGLRRLLQHLADAFGDVRGEGDRQPRRTGMNQVDTAVERRAAMNGELAWPRPAVAWWALLLFSVAAVLSYTDRQILSLLIDPMRGELL